MRLRTGLAVLAFRFAQTRTSLRLSRPYAHQAVGVLSVLIFNKKPRFFNLGFLLNMRRESIIKPTTYCHFYCHYSLIMSVAGCIKILVFGNVFTVLILPCNSCTPRGTAGRIFGTRPRQNMHQIPRTHIYRPSSHTSL